MIVGVEEQRENNGGVTGKGFAPGLSGNPNGRPKGQSITSIIRAMLDREDEANPGRTKGEQLATVMVREALAGDVKFAKMLWERVEGKVPDRVVLSREPSNLRSLSDDDLAALETIAGRVAD